MDNLALCCWKSHRKIRDYSSAYTMIFQDAVKQATDGQWIRLVQHKYRTEMRADNNLVESKMVLRFA